MGSLHRCIFRQHEPSIFTDHQSKVFIHRGALRRYPCLARPPSERRVWQVAAAGHFVDSVPMDHWWEDAAVHQIYNDLFEGLKNVASGCCCDSMIAGNLSQVHHVSRTFLGRDLSMKPGLDLAL